MEKGGNACCCQEMKRQIKSKHNEMINIIELWKLKATEQGIYWGKQVRDLKKEHTKTKDFAEKQLLKLQKAQEEQMSAIISKQRDLEEYYAAQLKAKDRDNKDLTRRVV